MTVLREALAAIGNAEAPPASSAHGGAAGAFAGSVQGLGAAEVERVVLSPDAVLAILEHEIRERHVAVAEYTRLGRDAEAAALTAQIEVLVGLGVASSASCLARSVSSA